MESISKGQLRDEASLIGNVEVSRVTANTDLLRKKFELDDQAKRKIQNLKNGKRWSHGALVALGKEWEDFVKFYFGDD